MDQISIHPGVIGGRREHPLSDTSKPRRAGKKGGKLAKKLANLNRRQTALASTLKDPRVKNPAAFKMPGSMND